jgi:hypothetical protein
MQTELEAALFVLDSLLETYVRVDRDLRFTFTNQMAASASRYNVLRTVAHSA